jgi:hypothetical protein
MTAVAALAEADMVSPPPTDCPAGTIGATNHAGPHCLPQSCGEGKACPAGQVCATQELCRVVRVFMNRTGDHQEEVIAGACVNGQCPEGTCRTERVCVAQGQATGGRRAIPEKVNVQGPAATGGKRAESPEPFPEPEAAEAPRPAPAGCRGVGAAGAVVGGTVAVLLAAIAFMLRRRRPKR